jgi:hypothetical protein
MALEDVSAHRGGTDPIEGLIRIETSPREQATPIIMEMIRRGSVDSGVTAATWTAALTRPDGVGEDAEISTAPVLITEHEVVFGRAAALPVQRAKAKPIAAGHSTGSHHRRNLAPRTNLLTCVRSPDRSHQPLGQTLGNICQNHRNFAETPA